MNVAGMAKTCAVIGGLVLALGAQDAESALFDLSYDPNGDGVIDVTNLVGTGFFSYDGDPVAGQFLLSDLSNVQMEVTFTGTAGTRTFLAPPFDPADDSLIAISVVDVGSGVFELVFTGMSASTADGSLDIDPVGDALLSHEPMTLLSAATGPALYVALDSSAGLDVFGDYIGISSPAIAEPATVALVGFGLGGLLLVRRRKVA